MIERALERAGETVRQTVPESAGRSTVPLPAERHAGALAGGRPATAEILVFTSLSVPVASWRQPAPLLDAVEQGLAGCDRREDQGHAGRERRANELDRAGPFDFAERRVDGDQAVAGDDPGQQDCHRLAVLATAARDRDEGAGPDHVPALAGKAYVGKAVGHGSGSRQAARETALRSPASPGRHCPPPPVAGSRGPLAPGLAPPVPGWGNDHDVLGNDGGRGRGERGNAVATVTDRQRSTLE